MKVPDALDGARLDRALAELFEIPVNAARRLLLADRVRVDGKRKKKGDAVGAGVDVSVAGHGSWLVPGPDVVPRLLVDDHVVVVVNKPAGMPCHPLVPGEGGTVVDHLVALFPEILSASEDPREAGLVHRLDTGTTGCLALARDRETWRELRAAFGDDQVDKGYLALVEGAIEAPFVVDDPVGHDPADARRMILDRFGKSARTDVIPRGIGRGLPVRHEDREFALVAVTAVGGRRHQVRVHLAASGHPLVGDVLYGAHEAADAPWHLLHAVSLALPGRPAVRAALPSAFVAAAGTRGLGIPEGGI